jgi:hypothetical protein
MKCKNETCYRSSYGECRHICALDKSMICFSKDDEHDKNRTN